MQGIRLNVDDDILSVRLPALLLKKTRTEGFKFLQPAIHAALKPVSYTHLCPGKCVAAVSWRATHGRPYARNKARMQFIVGLLYNFTFNQ